MEVGYTGRMSESKRGKRGPGRPRKYPKAVGDKHDGAPQLKVRLDPELFDWVQGCGGPPWVRLLLSTAREKGKLSAKDLAPLAEVEGS